MTETATAQERLTFSSYGKLLRTRWYIVFVCVVVGAAAGYGLGRTHSKSYQATATVLLTDPSGSVVSAEAVNSFAQIATSGLVLGPVAAANGVTQSSLKAATTISVPLNTDLLDIAVERSTGREAAQLSNAIATALTQKIPQISLAGLPLPRPRRGVNPPTPVTGAKVITPAQAPAVPTGPTTKVDVLIGLVVGLVIALTVVLLTPVRPRLS